MPEGMGPYMGTCSHQVLTTFLNLTGFHFSFTLIDFLIFFWIWDIVPNYFVNLPKPLKIKAGMKLHWLYVPSSHHGTVQFRNQEFLSLIFDNREKIISSYKNKHKNNRALIVKTFSRQRTKSIKEAFTLCRCRVNDFSR